MHPSEDEYWTPRCVSSRCRSRAPSATCCTPSTTISRCSICRPKKIKRLRLALATKPNNVFFWCSVPSQNLDNAYNADAIKACYKAQTHWIQALSRQAEKVEGYEIKFARDQDAFVAHEWPKRFQG